MSYSAPNRVATAFGDERTCWRGGSTAAGGQLGGAQFLQTSIVNDDKVGSTSAEGPRQTTTASIRARYVAAAKMRARAAETYNFEVVFVLERACVGGFGCRPIAKARASALVRYRGIARFNGYHQPDNRWGWGGGWGVGRQGGRGRGGRGGGGGGWRCGRGDWRRPRALVWGACGAVSDLWEVGGGGVGGGLGGGGFS